MATISLKFVNRNGRISLCATVVGTPTRHYKVVEGLKNPNLSKWDSRSQRFASRAQDDKLNNAILSDFIAKCQEILDTHEFENGSELFSWEKRKNEGISIQSVSTLEPQITLGDWIQKIVEEFKNPTRLMPSSSYQAYLTLFHKLEIEGKLIKQPVSELGDGSFVQLIDWLNRYNKSKSKGKNFVGTLRTFRSTLSRAHKARLTSYVPDFPYMDYAPVTHRISENAAELSSGWKSVITF